MASIIRKLTGFSFLLLLILSLIFLYGQTLTPSGGIFGNEAGKWFQYYTAYLVILALALIAALIFDRELILKLAKADYWRSFILRIPVFIVAFALLILIKFLIKGPGSMNFLGAVAYISVPVLIFHIFVTTQIEEFVFGGVMFTYIDTKINRNWANIITIIAFALLWHLSKSGGSIALLLTYVPLRMIFNYVRNNGVPLLSRVLPKIFGATPITQQANVMVHLAWNLFVVGFGG